MVGARVPRDRGRAGRASLPVDEIGFKLIKRLVLRKNSDEVFTVAFENPIRRLHAKFDIILTSGPKRRRATMKKNLGAKNWMFPMSVLMIRLMGEVVAPLSPVARN